MKLDHVFVFIEPGGPEIAALRDLGLTETYRRRHPGQGTANVCYAFDNMFLELLWMDDAAAAMSAPIRRTGLYERAAWRRRGTCPFGLSWRRGDGNEVAAETWTYMPPYLPAGVSIPVAVDGDDPDQPMMFESPGGDAPVDWPAEKANGLQRAPGYGSITRVALSTPPAFRPSPTLGLFESEGLITLAPADGWGLRLDLGDRAGRAAATLDLPSDPDRKVAWIAG